MSAERADALTRALLEFDGRSTGSLERFAAACPVDASLIADLCDFAASHDSHAPAAATWLLKRFGVTGARLSPGQTETLLRLLLRETSWLSRLHVLQMMDRLVLPARLAESLLDALAAQARGANAFIRAWSLHGAAALADQHPACRDRVLDLLAAAEADEAPSVRARLRRTRAAFDWIYPPP